MDWCVSRERGGRESRCPTSRRRTTSSASTTTAASTSGFGAFPARSGEFAYRDPESRGLTDTGWEIHPEGFGRVLRQAESLGRPILVTENGIATRNDGVRRDFLREHALVLRHRLEAGAPIEGYFYWSLLDNFEWLEGFRPRFGLFEVDYATFTRRRRPSADVFADLGRAVHAGGRGRRIFRRLSKVTNSSTPAARAWASVRS